MAKKAVFALAVVLCAAIFFAVRREEPNEPAVLESFRLGTYVRLTLYNTKDADAKLKRADDLIKSLENLFSMNIPSSDAARLNDAGGGWSEISSATADLLSKAIAIAWLTDGAFSPALGGLTSLWKIGTPEARVPADEEIVAALKHIDYTKIELKSENGKHFARLPQGMALDLGAIAKGRVADILKSRLAADNVESAIIDLGGNLDFIGEPTRGGPWRGGLQHPAGRRGEYFGVVEVTGLSVVTSGPYERFFEEDGVRYHHILDPATGRPARSGLSSVTIIDADSTRADALCTALFVMGEARAREFLQKHDDIMSVLVTEDNRVLVTPSAKNIFSLTDGEFSLAVIGDEK